MRADLATLLRDAADRIKGAVAAMKDGSYCGGTEEALLRVAKVLEDELPICGAGGAMFQRCSLAPGHSGEHVTVVSVLR
jgi:hypothetical protein